MENSEEEQKHVPVLLKEVVENIITKKDGIYIDGTLGLGGHTQKILENLDKKGRVVGFDKDVENLERAKQKLKQYGNQLIFINNGFEHLKAELEELKIEKVSGVLLDLGLSSPHLESSGRGFSFQKDEPLDMRFDLNQKTTAEVVLNQFSEHKLAEIFKEYGEERFAKKIASKIVHERRTTRITHTSQLVEIIEKVYGPKSPKKKRIHPATRVFQALRIFINDEIDVLKRGLEQAIEILEEGGRVVVISYHSLEDRMVKRLFKQEAKDCICPPEIIVCQCEHKAKLKIVTKKPIVPTEEEINENPRSRSAKMRVAERI